MSWNRKLEEEINTNTYKYSLSDILNKHLKSRVSFWLLCTTFPFSSFGEQHPKLSFNLTARGKESQPIQLGYSIKLKEINTPSVSPGLHCTQLVLSLGQHIYRFRCFSPRVSLQHCSKRSTVYDFLTLRKRNVQNADTTASSAAHVLWLWYGPWLLV